MLAYNLIDATVNPTKQKRLGRQFPCLSPQIFNRKNTLTVMIRWGVVVKDDTAQKYSPSMLKKTL